MKLLIHLIVISMLFIIPEIISEYSHPSWKRAPEFRFAVYFKSALYIAIFYLNYFLILPKTLLGRGRARVWAYIGWNLLTLIAMLALAWAMQHYAFPHKPRWEHHPNVWRDVSFMLRDGGMMVLTVALSTAMRYGENWASIEKRHEQLVASQKADELANLKSQLNPHFLFNTLNTIYALIEVSPVQAQEAVHELSALLRYVLYENPTSVKLSQEISFAKNYISLMQMRLPQGAIEASFDAKSNPEVAPLLFVTLIENAFKHGNTGVPGHKIEISISSNADGEVNCSTRNHFSPKSNGEGGGIGLNNLRRRLQLIYG
ncbi:MAG: sensor histidine kinase, partial [Muribaculaceae bacterium]|nr:sensor histidine kinase [Muribaculaceae bacterium]